VAGIPNIITLDVGGTSADVALVQDGMLAEVNARDLAGFPVRIPSLDVNAVGAGGGSIAWIDRDGLLKVGPHSAGAEPGPACYAAGGTDATVTDANVMLGRLNGEALLSGRMPIRRELAINVITALAAQLDVEPEAAALGIIQIACATMVKAIRAISIERGHTPSDFTLFVYGGAGPLHARDVACDLGILRIVVPPSPGILCAEGAMNSPLSTEFVASILSALSTEDIDTFHAAHLDLERKVADWFETEAVPEPQRRTLWTVGARYFGQNYELTLPVDVAMPEPRLLAEVGAAFHEAHERNYGFFSKDEPIQLVNLAVKALGELERPALPTLASTPVPEPFEFRDTLFTPGRYHRTPVFNRESLVRDQIIPAPAIIEQMDTTVLVFPGDICTVDEWGNILIRLEETGK